MKHNTTEICGVRAHFETADLTPLGFIFIPTSQKTEVVQKICEEEGEEKIVFYFF